MKIWFVRHRKECIWWIIGAFVVVLAAYVFFVWLPMLLPHLLREYGEDYSKELANYGLVGDSYGIFNAFFSLLAFVGLILTLWMQYKENKRRHVEEQYYKMLDFQRSVVENMVVYPVKKNKPQKGGVNDASSRENIPNPIHGRKVFVEYKLQIKYTIKAIREINEREGLKLSNPDVADIAYAMFYYGASSDWTDFMKEYLKDYSGVDKLVDAILKRIKSEKIYVLDRTNQNNMSVYSRNMYNAIKYIDDADCLSKKEKQSFVKILRAQLSNAELYVLFFYILSRFGKKWIEKDYVNKYQLIQNMPAKFCDGYEPKDYFPSVQFESDETTQSPFSEAIAPRV